MQPAEFGKMEHQAVMAALQFVHTQFENESFVTAFISGLPGYRSNITKGETQIKTQQSMGMFEGIARNMESGGIAAVELTHDFLLQYLDSFDDDAMVDLLGEANVGLLSAASIPERMEMMAGDFNYTFTGVSAAIQKDTLLGRLLQGSALAAQGIYQGLTNPSQWLSAIVETMGLRDRIEVYEQPMVSMAQMEQMLAAAAAGAYAGSRSPAGGGNGTEPKMPTMNQLEPTPPNPAEMTAEVG